MTKRLGRLGRLREDRGSVAVLFCFIVLTIGALATFLVDAGAQLRAADQADAYSSEAARAASIAVGPIPTGGPADTAAAAAAARSYLTGLGATGSVVVTGPATVQVTVTITEHSPVLGITFTQTRTHTAQLQVGVSTGEGVS